MGSILPYLEAEAASDAGGREELRDGRCAGGHFCLCRLCRGSDIRRVRFRGAVSSHH